VYEEQSQGKSLQVQLRNNVVSVSSALPSLALVDSSDLNAKAISSAAPAQEAAASSPAPTIASAAVTPVAAQQQTLVRVKVPTTRVPEQDLLLSHSYPRVAVAATQRLGKKRSQEDFLMTSGEAERGLYMSGLFDGHGGSGTAKHASQHLQNYIAKGLENNKGAAVPGIKAAFQRFDRWWKDAACDLAVSATGMDMSGSTAVVSVLQGDLLTVANAGDSHAFLIDSYGSSRRLSTPHDLTNEDEVARVLSAGGHIITKPNRKPRLFNKPQPYYGDMGALVTRSFGDSTHKAPNEIIISDPDVAQTKLQVARDAAMVLTSDGVTDVMTQEMLGELVNKAIAETSRLTNDKSVAAAAAAEAIVQQALALGSGDNITASVMLFNWQD